jgi:16S rRNA (uracil1498-N3)-methyltransferase
MQTPRFFIDERLPHEPGAVVVLPAHVAQHVQVLRLRLGERIVMFDGHGGECLSVLTALGKRNAETRIVRFDPVERESTLIITLVQALATGDKMDSIVQKAVELGVAAIQPIATQRATMKLSADRSDAKRAHWQSVATAACEQCGRNRVPPVHAPLAFEAWLDTPSNATRVVLHPEGSATLQVIANAPALEIAVGPEGGFADNEIAAAHAAGALLIAAGPRVMRTETAGPALIAALNALNGDWRQPKRMP